MHSLLALTAAIALELAGAWQLTQVFAAAAAPHAFIILHIFACVLAATALFGLLPEHYQNDMPASVLFLLMVCLPIPVLGMLGLGLGLVPALWRQRSNAKGLIFIRSDVVTILDRPPGRGPDRPVPGDGCLMGTLLGDPARERRVRALMSTMSLDSRHAFPLLRIGLADPDDDVRLLAYALITRKELALETRIATGSGTIDRAGDTEPFLTHRSQARDYWELAGHAHENTSITFLLERAQVHAQAAARLAPREADVQFLLGRILLKAHDLDRARAALMQAVAAGIALEKVAPFLAEIAFHRKHDRHTSWRAGGDRE